MKAKSWFLSLILPPISIIAGVVLYILDCTILPIIAGGFVGGLVPILIIVIKRSICLNSLSESSFLPER